MRKDRGKRYTQSEREELLQLFEQSGYGISQFSSEMGISYGTLKRWLKPESAKPAQFVELAREPAVDFRLKVDLPNGIRAEFPMSAEKSVATAWIRELKSC